MLSVVKLLRGLSVLVSATAMTVAQTAPPFSAATTWPVAGGPSAIVVRDVSGDGKPDLVASCFSTSKVSVAPGLGGGSFGAAVSYSVGTQPEGVAVGDLNLDGRLDLVVANWGSNSVSVLLGQAGGSFGVASGFAVGSNPRSVTLADIDRDGRLDVVSGNFGGNSVSVLRNVSAIGGALSLAAAATFAAGNGPRGVIAADVNRDGRPDLLTANMFTNDVSVLLSQTSQASAPAFAAASSVDVAPDPYSVAVADLNGDGRPDMVATCILGLVTVRFGDGLGGFGPRTHYAVESQPQQVVVSDLNRDGRQDLVVANFNSWSVSVLMGQGGGIFCPQVSYGGGAAPTGVAVAELSGDGKPDIVTTNFSASGASVLLNLSAPAGPLSFGPPVGHWLGNVSYSNASGDFDGDGQLDLVGAALWTDSVSVLLGQGGGAFTGAVGYATADHPVGVAVGDLSDDGDPDIVVANEVSKSISVLLNQGTGTFAAAADHPLSNGVYYVALADLDVDGRLDVLTAQPLGNVVTVLPGLGNGGLAGAVNTTAGSTPRAVAAGDLDRDGRPDVAATDFGELLVLRNLGGFTLAPPTVWPSGSGVIGVALADLNEDGKLDAAMAGQATSVAEVRMNQTPAGLPPAFGAASTYAVGQAPLSISSCDLDGDGHVDLATADITAATISVLRNQGNGTFAPKLPVSVAPGPTRVVLDDVDGDGRPDLSVADASSFYLSVASNQGPVVSAWTGLGYALEGVSGLPSLSGAGTLAPGSPCSLTLVNTNPNAPALLFTSLSSAPTAFKGGVLAAFPITTTVSLGTDFTGSLPFPFIWPAGVPSGTKIWFQYAVQDPAAIHNAALSNALMAVTP